MKINETKPVADVGRVVPPDPPATTPRDRVTVDHSRDVNLAMVTSKASVAGGRAQRLQDLEAQVRAGNYHPDPSKVADEILQDAEIDARLQALIRH
jgi:anti-sigma28 factor (negative regulator of flagellin synthesis)